MIKSIPVYFMNAILCVSIIFLKHRILLFARACVGLLLTSEKVITSCLNFNKCSFGIASNHKYS